MDWGQSGRVDSYRFAMVDPFSLIEIAEFEVDAKSCSINYGCYTDNYSSATIKAPDTYSDGLVRIEHIVTLPDGTEEREVLGTFFVDSCEKDIQAGYVEQTLTCYSTLWRLSQEYLDRDLVRKAGQTVEGGIRALCTAEGATLITMPEIDTATTHTRDIRFASAENRLECLNTYCGWKSWQLTVDDDGRQILQQYINPRYKAAKYTFEAGANCVYLPQEKETFTGDVCNRVVAKWSRESIPSPSDGFGLSDTVTVDLPSTSPMSYQVCGRRITHVLELDEPVSHAELTATATDYLVSHDAAIRYLEIEHAGIPHLRAGDVVEYLNPLEAEDSLLCEITQMDISSLGPLMLTKSKLKVIA